MFEEQKLYLLIFLKNLNPKLTSACSHSRPEDLVIKKESVSRATAKTENRFFNVATKENSSIFAQFTAKANSVSWDLEVLLVQVSSAKIWTKTKQQIFHKLVVSRKVKTLHRKHS